MVKNEGKGFQAQVHVNELVELVAAVADDLDQDQIVGTQDFELMQFVINKANDNNLSCP